MLFIALCLGCASRSEVTQSECRAFQERACRAGCTPSTDCAEPWRLAAEADAEDTLESCIALCPETRCGGQSFFECGCYAECVARAPAAVQSAIVEAVTCDRGSVEECAP